MIVRNLLSIAFVGLGIVAAGGCTSEPPPVERVPVAAPQNQDSRIEYEHPKPLPDQARLSDRALPPEPPFEDPPLVSQKAPEQARFEQAYRAVGRPRIVVFVNRTLEGEMKEGHYDDDARAAAIDYQAMENILTDFLSCQGAVEIMSPTMARQKLTDEQAREVQAGKMVLLRQVAQQLDADVLVQVSAHPSRQTENGTEVRLVGEALNIKGGQQVGRAVVDIPPPLDKPTLNKYTRFVARKLMMDLTQSWSSTEAPPATTTPRTGTGTGTPDTEKK
ncbi:MAG TPA: hypothetical protein VH475_00275 [Tepidisphaeraceae bacterium]|jgi:hypothetical protein